MRVAIIVAHKGPTAFHDQLCPGFRDLFEFALPFTFANQRLKRRDRRGKIALEEEFVRVLAKRFLRGPAVEPLGASIPVENLLVHVSDTDGIPGLVEEGGTFAALALGAFAALAFPGLGNSTPDGRNEAGEALLENV